VLAKKTPKNLITRGADEVRERLAQLGIEERDVTAAVTWSRETEDLQHN
jgi:hypothetical protein